MKVEAVTDVHVFELKTSLCSCRKLIKLSDCGRELINKSVELKVTLIDLNEQSGSKDVK